MIKKVIVGLLMAGSLSAPAMAHVVVKPATVAPAEFQTFTMGVPVEKDIATISVRLVIPDGLNHVTPTVKPGWTIEIKKGEGDNSSVKEIIWSGSQIPPGQRDDFSFSAQSPAKEQDLTWKAYQTYADATVVAWDQKPKEDNHKEGEALKPYSFTAVTEAGAENSQSHNAGQTKGVSDSSVAIALSVVALALSVVALGRRKK